MSMPLWDADTVRALRAGVRLEGWHPSFPRKDDVDAASLWREGNPWGPRSIIVDGLVAGSIGFFGPPTPADDGVDEVEVGYGLVEEVRGRGVATRALLAALSHCDSRGGPGPGQHRAPTTPRAWRSQPRPASRRSAAPTRTASWSWCGR